MYIGKQIYLLGESLNKIAHLTTFYGAVQYVQHHSMRWGDRTFFPGLTFVKGFYGRNYVYFDITDISMEH